MFNTSSLTNFREVFQTIKYCASKTRNGEIDFYRLLAARMYSVSYENVTPMQREEAKMWCLEFRQCFNDLLGTTAFVVCNNDSQVAVVTEAQDVADKICAELKEYFKVKDAEDDANHTGGMPSFVHLHEVPVIIRSEDYIKSIERGK